jgi:hypothetical protein
VELRVDLNFLTGACAFDSGRGKRRGPDAFAACPAPIAGFAFKAVCALHPRDVANADGFSTGMDAAVPDRGKTAAILNIPCPGKDHPHD